jgi:hypothetical protein
VHIGFCWWNLTDGEHTEDAGLDGRIILNGLLKIGMGTGTVSISLKIGPGSGLL